MVKYFINDIEYQLTPKSIIALTSQFFDIVKLTETQASFTNTFEILLSNSNAENFDFCNVISSDSDFPYEFQDSHLQINGFDFYGKSVIESFVENSFSVMFYGETVNIFDLLNELNINQLDLSEYDHNWNFANVTDSRNNTEGYIYPIVDWSDNMRAFSGLATVNPEYLLPCFYAHTILEKIFARIGYTYSGDLFANDKYLNLVLTLQTKITDAIIYKIKNTYAYSQDVLTGFEAVHYTGSKTTYLNMNIQPFDPYNLIFQTQLFNVNLWNFRALNKGAYVFYSTVRFTRPNYAGTVHRVVIQLIKIDGVTVIKEEALENINDVQLYPSSDFTISFRTETNLDENERFFVKFIAYANAVPVDVDSTRTYLFIKYHKLACIGFTPDSDNIVYGNDVIINANLPDISASDFIKTIKYIFGQFITVDSLEKKVYFKSLDAISETASIDWSTKFHKLLSVSFHPDLSQQNIFKYRNDSIIDPELGIGYVNISDTTLEKKQTLIELPFSATERAAQLTDTSICRIKVYELIEAVITRKNEFKDRILLLNKLTGYTDITYNDGVAIPVTSDSNIPYSYFVTKTDSDFDTSIADADKAYNGLDFANIIENDYQIFTNIFDKFKAVTAVFKLSENDVVSFDNSVPIYVKQLFGKYYVNSIREFKGSEKLTVVELIRL